MSETEDPLLEATTALVPALLTGLEALAYAGRHLHPPQLPGLIESLDGFDDKIDAGKTAFDAAPWPEHLHFFRDQLNIAADAALRPPPRASAPGPARCVSSAAPACRTSSSKRSWPLSTAARPA